MYTEKITVEQGKLKGLKKDGYNFYGAIPYAKAPIGNLRYRRPHKAEQDTPAWDVTDTVLNTYPHIRVLNLQDNIPSARRIAMAYPLARHPDCDDTDIRTHPPQNCIAIG